MTKIAGMGTLNIENIKTIEQLNNVDWEKYTSFYHPKWIKHIRYPISCDTLNGICRLSNDKNSNVKLAWDMGELHFV